MAKTLNITIPAPHDKQAEIESCKKKRILVNAGRRAGKTFMVARMMVRRANKGRRQLYIAPVSVQTDAVWALIAVSGWLMPYC